MSKLIHIYSLPRSGTAFITTMLNLNPRAMCYHELIEKSPQHRQTITRMLKCYDYVVDCNTVGWLLRDQPIADINICIKRDTTSSLKAVRKVIDAPIDETAYRECASKLDSWAIQTEAVIVKYEHLFNLKTLLMIWNHCFDGEVFPVNKVSVLLDLNVQVQSPQNVMKQEFLNRLKEEMV